MLKTNLKVIVKFKPTVKDLNYCNFEQFIMNYSCFFVGWLFRQANFFIFIHHNTNFWLIDVLFKTFETKIWFLSVAKFRFSL